MTEILRQADFARRCGVSRARVAQWLAEGKIQGDGVTADRRIVVAVALQQLKRSLDAGQMVGNGIETRLGEREASPAAGEAGRSEETGEPARSSGDLVGDQIRLEKLRQMRAATRRQEVEARASSGVYTRTAEVEAGMRKLAGRLLIVFDGGLVEMASELAAKFKLPQRDVLHQMRLDMRKIRERAAAEASLSAAALPVLVEDPIDEQNPRTGDG